MKVMLNGTDSLWRLWLGFFREHFAAIMSLVVLLRWRFISTGGLRFCCSFSAWCSPC